MPPAGGWGEDEIELLSPRADVFERSGAFDGVVDVSSARRRAGRDPRRAGVDPVTVELERGGGGEDTGEGEERARSRAATALAALEAAALLAVGAAALWWSDDGGLARSPATTASPSTSSSETPTSPRPTPPPPTGRRLPGPEVDSSPDGPGWTVVDPPAGTAVVGPFDPAWLPASEDRLDIWASPGADPLTGTWLSVAAAPVGGGGDADLLPGGVAVDVGGRAGSVATDVDGVVLLTWHPDASHRLTLTAFGVSLDRLVAVAGSIAFEREEIVYSSPPDVVLGVALDRSVHTRGGTSEVSADALELYGRMVVALRA